MGFFRSLMNLPVGGPLGVIPGLYKAATGNNIAGGGSGPGAPPPGDSRDPSQLQWDSNTFMPTSGGPPSAQQAANWDWQSQRLYQEAKARQFSDATGSYDQALSTLGGYRAGGAASAAAQILQNKGSLQLNIGNSLERPDAFANARQQAHQDALHAAKQAQRMQMLGGVIQAGAGIIGAGIGASVGGPAGAVVGSQAGQAMGGALGANAGAMAGSAPGSSTPTSTGGMQGPGASMQSGGAGGGGPQPMQGQAGGQQGTAKAGLAPSDGAQQMAAPAVDPAVQTATTFMAASRIDWNFWARRDAQLEAMVN